MKKEKIELNRNNYIGLTMFCIMLALGAVGGIAEQKWAENIYTFLTICLMIAFIVTALSQTEFRPVKEYLAIFFIHALFSAAMGWMLFICWIFIMMSMSMGMHYYLEAAKESKEVVESENQD